ncbi:MULTISPECIES: sec-independent translocase [Streptomyces]|uniref:Sec-independent protein translocase protein TatB n=1 Tax=Streptomyces chilikensis TaxID=1194079 RepID=A0ABV3ESI9_9ACTN|nr:MULTISPECIES: sec-independent translocase [Streptomyces]MDH6225131.1 sec-independent protein translocase protein TatB [Streptomyces sp. MJP52]
MFNDIGPLELITLVVLAVLVFGPDKLPKVVRDVSRTIRKIREFSESAKNDIREELGPEYKDFEFQDLNPKTFIRKQLQNDDLGLNEIRESLDLKKDIQQLADPNTTAGPSSPAPSTPPAAAGPGPVGLQKKPEPAAAERPPYDLDAT